jgi:hypothetical protein
MVIFIKSAQPYHGLIKPVKVMSIVLGLGWWMPGRLGLV